MLHVIKLNATINIERWASAMQLLMRLYAPPSD
jgi:hypothetical protein